MKRFDYSAAKLNMEHEKSGNSAPEPPVQKTEQTPSAPPAPPKRPVKPKEQTVRPMPDTPIKSQSQEDMAREKAAAEKAVAQSQVDDVLDQKAKPVKKKLSVVVIPSSDDDIENNIDDTDKQSVNIQQSPSMNMSQHVDSRYEDSFVNDFKDNFGKEADDAVVVEPGQMINRTETQQPVDSNSESNPVIQNIASQIAQVTPPVIPKVPGGVSTSVNIVDEKDIKRSQVSINKQLIEYLKPLFPAANNMSEMIDAYLYVKLGYPANVSISDRMKEVIDSYNGTDMGGQPVVSQAPSVSEEITDDMLKLKGNDKAILNKLEAIEMAVSYFISEYSGWKDPDASPASAKFNNAFINDFMLAAEKAAALRIGNRQHKDGRPIR